MALFAQRHQVVALILVEPLINTPCPPVRQSLLNNVVCVQRHMLFGHWPVPAHGTLLVPVASVVPRCGDLALAVDVGCSCVDGIWRNKGVSGRCLLCCGVCRVGRVGRVSAMEICLWCVL